MTELDKLVKAYVAEINRDELMSEFDALAQLPDAKNLEIKLNEKGLDSLVILRHCMTYYGANYLSLALDACNSAVDAGVDIIEYLDATREVVMQYAAGGMNAGNYALKASSIFLSATKDYAIINNTLTSALDWVKALGETYADVLHHIYYRVAKLLVDEKNPTDKNALIHEEELSGVFSYCLNLAQQLSKQTLTSEQIINFFKEDNIKQIYSAYHIDAHPSISC